MVSGLDEQMVPGEGFEPSRGLPRRILSAVRLPFRHPGRRSITKFTSLHRAQVHHQRPSWAGAWYELRAGYSAHCAEGGRLMGRIRQPAGAPGGLWIHLAVAAMGFSLAHTVVDFGIVLGPSSASFGAQQGVLSVSVLIGVLYAWWAWVFAKAIGGAKAWLVGLMAFNILWVGGNGLTVLECPPPCSALPLYADTLHLGNLILAPLAAYSAYRAMRRMPGPGSWLVMGRNVIIMLALVVAIVALLTSLAGA